MKNKKHSVYMDPETLHQRAVHSITPNAEFPDTSDLTENWGKDYR
jgi:hypothetical protein